MREGVIGLGIGGAAVACCGLLPIVAGAVGGVALAALFGIAAAAGAVVGLIAIVAWRRRRRGCAVESEGER